MSVSRLSALWYRTRVNWSGRKLVWLGVAGIFIPLVVLLVLQFRWLSTLERTSTLAHYTSLDAFLIEVSSSTEELAPLAQQLLEVPPSAFSTGKEAVAIAHFRANASPLFRAAFLYWLDGDRPTRWLVRGSDHFVEADTQTNQWIALTTGHLKLLREKAVPLDEPELWVDERDPSHRMMLLARTDVTGQVVGVAGVEIDERAFVDQVLPARVQAALASNFTEDVRKDLAVSVRSEDGEELFSSCDEPKGHDERVIPFPFVFKDWRLSVKNREFTPQQLARFNFHLNVAGGLAVVAVLVAGIVLMLRGAQRELRLSQMKSDFVSNVSHELKTPLASIRLFGELLRSGRVASPEKVREYGSLIETEGRRLSQLITNILDFSRIESARRPYAREPVDLGALVKDTLERFEVAVKHQGFTIDFRPPAKPVVTRGDAGALGQAVFNLVDNALKYSKDDRRLEVELSCDGAEGMLVVRDHGVGIPKDEQEKIFDRFHRVSTGLVHEVRGSGLGLSIVKQVVEAHRGRIEVQSEVGKGSAFTVYLPCLEDAEAVDAPATQTKDESEVPR